MRLPNAKHLDERAIHSAGPSLDRALPYPRGESATTELTRRPVNVRESGRRIGNFVRKVLASWWAERFNQGICFSARPVALLLTLRYLYDGMVE